MRPPARGRRHREGSKPRSWQKGAPINRGEGRKEPHLRRSTLRERVATGRGRSQQYKVRCASPDRGPCLSGGSGQTREVSQRPLSYDRYAHSWRKRRVLKPDLCVQARQSTRGHSALRRARLPRRQDGESHSRRTYQAIPRNGTTPRTATPRRQELAFQDVEGNRV